MRDHVVECLLTLLTSRDRAVAIAGDLAEERERHGSTWFWMHVVRVTCALWRNSVADAPLRVLALVLVGLVLLSAVALGGVASVFLVPRSDLFAGWIALPFVWWGGALFTGASLVAIAPRRGMAACALLAVAGEGLLLGFGGPAIWRDPSNTDFVIFCTVGMVAAAALLTGGAIVSRRMAVWSAAALGHQR